MVFACLAALALLAPAATSGQDPSKDPRGIVFRQTPTLNEVVQQCGDTSPLKNSCTRDLSSEACRLGCAVVAKAGFAYTGIASAAIYGKGSDGSARWISVSCPYVSGTQTNAAGLGTGHCQWSSNAEEICMDGACGVIMWPPFRLGGTSSPLAAAPPAGSWAVTVER